TTAGPVKIARPPGLRPEARRTGGGACSIHAARPGGCQAPRGSPECAPSEQRRLPAARRGWRVPEVTIRLRGGDATALRALEKAVLDEKGLVHLLDGAFILSSRGGDGPDAGGPAVELLDDGLQDAGIHVIQPER